MKKRSLALFIVFVFALSTFLISAPSTIFANGHDCQVGAENGVLGDSIDIYLFVRLYDGYGYELSIDSTIIDTGTVTSDNWVAHRNWIASTTGNKTVTLTIKDNGTELDYNSKSFYIGNTRTSFLNVQTGPPDGITELNFGVSTYLDNVTWELSLLNSEWTTIMFYDNGDVESTGSWSDSRYTTLPAGNYMAIFNSRFETIASIEGVEFFSISAGNSTGTESTGTESTGTESTGTESTGTESNIEPVWIRDHEMTCYQVWVNEDNDFEFVFWWEYANNNWVKIYDMAGNEVFSIDMEKGNARFEADLTDGFYTVKTFHDGFDTPIQEFLIGKP